MQLQDQGQVQRDKNISGTVRVPFSRIYCVFALSFKWDLVLKTRLIPHMQNLSMDVNLGCKGGKNIMTSN